MRVNRRLLGFLLLVLLSLGLTINLTSCGGGGGGGGSDNGGGNGATTGTGTITGSVSGTTVIAVNDNGDIVASDDTVGKTPDAQGEYPFSLAGIPAGVNVRVYLITGGGVFPMYFDSNGDNVPDTNVFSLSSTANISLGFVSVHVAGQDGRAIPDFDPTDTPGVSSHAENTNVPDCITNPTPPNGSSLSQIINEGLNALNSGWVSKANNYFKSAVSMLNNGESQNDRDTVHFFYAATRLIALGFDITSDGNPNDMNRAGDLMDRFGCNAADSHRANVDSVLCPEQGSLPANSPTTTDLKNFGDSVIQPQIEGAIADLNAVSSSFNKAWKFDNEGFESDYGDVLALRAGLKLALAEMDINRAYHQHVDIDFELNILGNTIEEFLAFNPSVLTLSDAAKLSTAKSYIISALDDLTSAVNTITAEADAQSDDLIALVDVTSTEALADIADIKASLTGNTQMWDNDLETGNEFTLNMSSFFAGAFVDLQTYFPTFAGNDQNGPFPDATLGGVLPLAPAGININDLNEDGILDYLEP